MSKNNGSITKQFPQGFLWGSATSSHQIEGQNRLNDWWEWEALGKTPEPSKGACNSYELYKEDFQLAKQMNHNAHRFSIEWSRIEPKQGIWDEDAILHYKEIIQELKVLGIEPVVTLHHFTNPSWITSLGGWENPKIVEWFSRYVKKVVSVLGIDVKYWITFNEQNVFTYKGYLEKTWPPGKHSVWSAIRVTRNIAKAHCKSYEIIHNEYKRFSWKKPFVGVAHHFMACEPLNNASVLDRSLAWVRRFMCNELFMRMIYHSPFHWVSILTFLWGKAYCLDFIGVNYYFREVVKASKASVWWESFIGSVQHNNGKQSQSERNDLQWEIYPKGLNHILRDLYQRYRVPLMITENGIPTKSEDQRQRFIYNHLSEIHDCITNHQVPIMGYMYWSLLDNFEWAIGYGPKFGLIHVDLENYKRSLKSSAEFYSKVCLTNSITPELLSS